MTSLGRAITAIFCRLIIAHFYENVNMIDICNMEKCYILVETILFGSSTVIEKLSSPRRFRTAKIAAVFLCCKDDREATLSPRMQR